MLASVASLASVVVGGLSDSVPMYIASAMILGVYFALQSGTVDSIVYDTLIEETGSADDFETRYGRIQMLQSVALTVSAVAGGVIASLAAARLTYFLTIPAGLLGVIVLSRFREPTLHRARETSRLRDHLGATTRILRERPRLLPVVLAMTLGSAALQMIFEFGPLWLVAASAPAFLFGPYTAGLTSALGAGGVLAGRLRLSCPQRASATSAVMIGSAVALTADAPAGVAIAAQAVLVLLLATLSIHLSKLLHDAVPSTMRTAVSSGVGTLSWLAFLPASLLFGAVGTHSVHAAGWVVVVPVCIASVALVKLASTSGALCPRLGTALQMSH
jgi:hypothetical protein